MIVWRGPECEPTLGEILKARPFLLFRSLVLGMILEANASQMLGMMDDYPCKPFFSERVGDRGAGDNRKVPIPQRAVPPPRACTPIVLAPTGNVGFGETQDPSAGTLP